jgi:NAD(P)-dependent dehydrogenase (short-subunit alcohol dehydrogenase family)
MAGGRLGAHTVDRKDHVVKLRNVIVLGAGIGIGYVMARRLHEDDPEVVHGPRRSSSTNPMLAAVTSQTQRLADQATVKSLDAIRKARGAIRNRLNENVDEAAWN